MFRVFAALVLVLMLTACTGTATPIPASPSEEPSPVALASVQPTTPPPTPESTAPDPCLTREGLAAMSLESIAARDVICYRSESGTETQVDQRAAVSAIRSLVGQAPHVIAFQEITIAPNSPSGDLKVLRLVDDRGYSYQVAPVAGKVVEMDPPTSWRPSDGPPRSLEELQLQAETLIAGQFPGFDSWKPTLDFEVGSKSEGVYFFRWQQPGPVDHMPVLAQVGMTETGEVFSYLNTLFYLR